MTGAELRARLEALGHSTGVARAAALGIKQPNLSRLEGQAVVSQGMEDRVERLELRAELDRVRAELAECRAGR